jgi:hypothetical protein
MVRRLHDHPNGIGRLPRKVFFNAYLLWPGVNGCDSPVRIHAFANVVRGKNKNPRKGQRQGVIRSLRVIRRQEQQPIAIQVSARKKITTRQGSKLS